MIYCKYLYGNCFYERSSLIPLDCKNVRHKNIRHEYVHLLMFIPEEPYLCWFITFRKNNLNMNIYLFKLGEWKNLDNTIFKLASEDKWTKGKHKKPPRRAEEIVQYLNAWNKEKKTGCNKLKRRVVNTLSRAKI